MTKKQEKLIIIDGHALLHRAFHAVPPLTTKDGLLVNAVYGFTSILLKIFKEFEPEYIACTFDLAAPTFRHEEFEDYKAQRVKAPDELYAQIDLIQDVLEAFNIPIYTAKGFEADDVIGTIVTKLNKTKPDLQCIIVTGDMDALQLVNDQTSVFTLKQGINDTITYDPTAVKERYGFAPKQLIDFKALRGDPSDNIPGVPGVGEKTATELVKKYHSLDNIYQNIDDIDILSDRFKGLLKEHKDSAYQSYRLATIVTNVKLPISLTAMKTAGFDADNVYQLFQKLEFRSLLNKIPNKLAQGVKTKETNEFATINNPEIQDFAGYRLVANDQTWKNFIKKLKQQTIFAFDTETTSLNTLNAELLGISFCWQIGEAYYLDIKNNESWLRELKSVFENPTIKKIGHNIKYDYSILKNVNIDTNNLYFDTLIAAYLLFPTSRSLKLDDLAFSECGHKMQPITDLIGPKGKKQLTMADIAIDRVNYYACEDADYTWRLYKKLDEQISEAKMFKLFNEIEMPLVKILANMEIAGIQVDEKFLQKMSKKLGKKIIAIEKETYKMAGVEFNMASPKQLKEILFDKLQISTKGLKKTKTGFSTNADQLEKMKGLHPIIELISEFREYSKLKNTYLDALPELINARTKRVHTSYNQAVTATGRLSSSDPNLQNIPIRTELGREIRKAFVAKPGYQLIAADYSQIELRVAASLANDPKMIAAFNQGKDIHSSTAAEINKVNIKDVTFDQRRQAKEVNFGIIYGLGATGLSQRTGISRNEAKNFIEEYLKLYKKIKDYLDETKKLAHQQGYVETLFDRRRYIPDINSHIPFVRAAAERVAINMPIQGTAADLLKMAMIQIAHKLPELSKDTKMLLQVHDELVLEVPEADLKKVAKFIKKEMENIHQLKVPIIADIKTGPNWGEMK
ncbi:MAG: DNA polymerase I [Candidatus Komeilibacteria bacterium]